MALAVVHASVTVAMSSDERACARELREQAAHSEIDGAREAALALAERYEQEAASRTGAR